MVHFFMRLAGKRDKRLKQTKLYRVSAVIATVLLLQFVYKLSLLIGHTGYIDTLEILANVSLGVGTFVAIDEIFIKQEQLRQTIYKDPIAASIYVGIRLFAIAWIIVNTLN